MESSSGLRCLTKWSTIRMEVGTFLLNRARQPRVKLLWEGSYQWLHGRSRSARAYISQQKWGHDLQWNELSQTLHTALWMLAEVRKYFWFERRKKLASQWARVRSKTLGVPIPGHQLVSIFAWGKQDLCIIYEQFFSNHQAQIAPSNTISDHYGHPKFSTEG